MDLYRWEPNAESLALLVCLHEKGLAFDDHYVDVLALENHSDEYRALSPTGVVPLLVVGDAVMPDAAIAMQYLEEAHPEVPLGPADPGAWYDMQAWMARFAGPKAFGANVNLLGWNRVMLTALPGDTLAAYRDGLAALPREKQSGWGAVWSDAEAGEDELANAGERVADVLGRMDGTIASNGWLAGDDYSLADILAYAYAHCLPELDPATANAKRYPAVMAWLEKVAARPAVQQALLSGRLSLAGSVFRAPGS
jgi:glutathione S-transferase